MKNLCKKTIIMLFTVFLSFTVLGCGDTTTINSNLTTAPEEVTIDGEYIIDITDLGMPLQIYLKIETDDTFQLSSDRTYEVDKGHGTVASSGDTYMFIYSNSTAETPNTSTFTVENKNLHFSTTLNYGSSNLPASKVDENNPDITYYLVAKGLMYEDYFGEYGGTHTVSAMGSEVEYEYFLTLGEGREYSFVSNFHMMGDDHTYEESGYYDMDGVNITLKMEGEDNIQGTFDNDMNLTIPIKASDMGDRESRTLQIATTASCSGTYYGQNTDDLTLILDKFGGYIFKVAETTIETGSFSVDETLITYSPADSSESYTATLENYKLNGEFLLTSEATSRTEVDLYCELVQGTFVAEGEDEAENEYSANLELSPDGTFTFIVTDDQDAEIINESGDFSVTKTFFTQLVLTTANETTFTCVISEVGLMVNVMVSSDVEVGFILIKE